MFEYLTSICITKLTIIYKLSIKLQCIDYENFNFQESIFFGITTENIYNRY